jgi:hypothetical protein
MSLPFFLHFPSSCADTFLHGCPHTNNPPSLPGPAKLAKQRQPTSLIHISPTTSPLWDNGKVVLGNYMFSLHACKKSRQKIPIGCLAFWKRAACNASKNLTSTQWDHCWLHSYVVISLTLPHIPGDRNWAETHSRYGATKLSFSPVSLVRVSASRSQAFPVTLPRLDVVIL